MAKGEDAAAPPRAADPAAAKPALPLLPSRQGGASLGAWCLAAALVALAALCGGWGEAGAAGLRPRDLLLMTGWSGESFAKVRAWNYLRKAAGSATQDLLHAGPGAWRHLRDDKGAPLFPACAGAQQSPIDLPSTTASGAHGSAWGIAPARPLALTLPSAPLRLASQHTAFGGVQFFPLLESNVTWALAGAPLHLRQFHFHTPSEHTIDGRAFAMELHLVFFKDGEASPRAVLGLLFDADAAAPNAALEGAWAHLHRSEHHTHDNKVPVAGLLHLDRLLAGAGEEYYRYPGSLTTPPCSEGVDWHVFVSRQGISEGQRAAFEESLPGREFLNYRDTQPVGGRRVELLVNRGAEEEGEGRGSPFEEGGAAAAAAGQGL